MIIQNKTIYLTPKYDYLYSDVEGAKNRFDYKKDKLVNCVIKTKGIKLKSHYSIGACYLHGFKIIENCKFYADETIVKAMEMILTD